MTKMSAIALYSSYTVTKLNAVKLVYCGQPIIRHPLQYSQVNKLQSLHSMCLNQTTSLL